MKSDSIATSDILNVRSKMIVVRGQTVLLDRDVAANAVKNFDRKNTHE